MKSFLASVRAGGGLDRVDHAVQRLEDEWRKHGDVPLERHWEAQRRLPGAVPGESLVLLAELIKTDLRCRFARGLTPAVAGYLDRFPELQGSDSRVLSLIYEEFCLAEERGDRIDVEAFCARYPRWKESLVSQLQYHHLLSQAAGARPKAPPFPEAGETFEEFQLVSLLGRGGTSRVFLARDLSLGGKQVVLKVSLDRGREPQAQGALDHPHIVPVNSVVFGDEGMRGLSMPFRPGLPLDEVIRRVDPASRPRSAMALWEALVRPAEGATGPAPPPAPKGDGWEGFPVRGSYAQGVAWVVKVVAEALHYAHGQQTFHRDVKPANILLTIQHGPQLLDFNLAESPHSASQAQAAMHGGTLPYMAPEQIEAFLDSELWGKVGAQADIYSLGLVLRELLTGQAPDLPAETMAPARAMRVLLDRRPLLDVSVRRANPDIPHALEAIVARCLKVGVEDRYPDAGALADDLDRFLARRPLAHAVNLSHRERCWNWGVRHRGWVGAALVSLACVLVGMKIQQSLNTPRIQIPIGENPKLAAAMSALYSGRAKQSLAPLLSLADDYPRSSLPRAYLGLAYVALENYPVQAVQCINGALAMPNAREELIAWSAREPELLRRIDPFVHHQLDTAVGPAPKRKVSHKGGQVPAGTDVYEMTRWAHPLFAAVLTNPEVNDFDLARAEQELEDYESVIRLAGQDIGELASRLRKDGGAELKKRLRELYEWRRLRSRALIKLAERLRGEGTEPRLREGLKDLNLAEEDLKACFQYIDNQSDNSLDQHGLERIRVAGRLARVQIELDLGQRAKAQSHFNRARESLRRYADLARIVIVDDFKDVDSWYRRLEEIGRRLRQDEETPRAEGRSTVPPEKTAQQSARAG